MVSVKCLEAPGVLLGVFPRASTREGDTRADLRGVWPGDPWHWASAAQAQRQARVGGKTAVPMPLGQHFRGSTHEEKRPPKIGMTPAGEGAPLLNPEASSSSCLGTTVLC